MMRLIFFLLQILHQTKHDKTICSFITFWFINCCLFLQSQFAVPAESSMEVDLTTERREANEDDWLDEFYQVTKDIRDRYYTELNEALRKLEIRHRQLASVQPETEDHRKVNKHLDIARTLMQTIQLPKDKIPPRLKGKLDLVKQYMSALLNLYGPRTNNSSQQKDQTHGVDVPNSKPQTVSHLVPLMNPQFQSINLNCSTHKNAYTSVQHEPIVSSEGTASHQNIVMNAQNQSTKSDVLQSIHLQQQKEHQMEQQVMQQDSQIEARNGVGVKGGILFKRQNLGQSSVNNEQPRILEVASSQVPPWTDPKHFQSPVLKPTSPIQYMGSSCGLVCTSGEVVKTTPLLITSPGLSPCDDREPSDTENPIQHLLRAVGSMSSNALNASLNEMVSVVNLAERTAGSVPDNGSQSLVGKELAASNSLSLEGGGDFIWESMFSGKRKSQRFITTDPLDNIATSSCERFQIEADPSLAEEIREVNQRLIDTVVFIISDEGGSSMACSSLTEVSKGTTVECIFRATTVTSDLNTHLSSAKLFPLKPLRLLVPKNYPSCSPVLPDDLSAETSMDDEYLSLKAKLKLGIYLQSFKQPMSVGDIARAWDICLRAAICEYAEQKGGGSFTSKYGTWETL